jgi:hypothetical protein
MTSSCSRPRAWGGVILAQGRRSGWRDVFGRRLVSSGKGFRGFGLFRILHVDYFVIVRRRLFWRICDGRSSFRRELHRFGFVDRPVLRWFGGLREHFTLVRRPQVAWRFQGLRRRFVAFVRRRFLVWLRGDVTLVGRGRLSRLIEGLGGLFVRPRVRCRLLLRRRLRYRTAVDLARFVIGLRFIRWRLCHWRVTLVGVRRGRWIIPGGFSGVRVGLRRKLLFAVVKRWTIG